METGCGDHLGGWRMTHPSVAGPNELNELLAAASLEALNGDQVTRFQSYLELIMKWNDRMNLTAVRDRPGILSRHFVECIACARALPRGLRTILDLGSGAGLPGIPIAICRPELSVTLVESQAKKAAFLNEVARSLSLQATVFRGRAESMIATFDCVTLRAVDRMAQAIEVARALIAEFGWLAVMSTARRHQDTIRSVDKNINWMEPIQLPGSEQRILLLGRAK